MPSLTPAEAASRAGVEPAFIDRLIDLHIIELDADDGCSIGDVRRALMARSLDDAGIPLDAVAEAKRRGSISFDFFDTPAYDRFVALSSETFQDVSDRTGIPLDLLAVMREAMGLAEPAPGDRLTENELLIVPFIELQFLHGFRRVGIERLLRVHGDSTRRIAEQEAAWWQEEVVRPGIEAGIEIGNADFSNRSTPLAEQAMLAMYRSQQGRAWTTNMIESYEILLENEGVRSRLERPPAICFLDITGYTRLTQERGDDAAADLAANLARLVHRSSVQHGGKPIKWLGDGVMFHFRDPAPAVRSALEMLSELGAAGLPPAHVGLHCGPVLFQEGDYFGQTVNLSARIADYARPGEVLVSEAVADAAGTDTGLAFQDIGAVELKGVAGTTHLLRAYLA